MKANWSVGVLVALIVGLGLAALSCKGKSNPVAPPGADVTITIVGNLAGNSYSPNPDTVSVGQTVAWSNTNGTTHTATSDSPGIFSKSVSAGTTSSSIMMNTAGSFPYHCTIHAGMVGTLVVKP